MRKRIVTVLDGASSEAVMDMFARRGYEVRFLSRPEETHKHVTSDLICFTGGSDVTPALYGAENYASGSSLERDLNDLFFYKAFYKHPKIGICRGGQFLAVMNGCRMFQDVNNHAGKNHMVTDAEDGNEYLCSSTHHQMIDVSGTRCFILGYSTICTHRLNADGDEEYKNDAKKWKDVEVTLNSDQSISFQPHPEYGPESCEKFFFKLIDKRLLG